MTNLISITCMPLQAPMSGRQGTHSQEFKLVEGNIPPLKDKNGDPLFLEDGEMYILTSWNRNVYIKIINSQLGTFNVEESHGEDLDDDSEMILVSPKY